MAKSSTAEVHIENGFQVAYEDESHAEGDYIVRVGRPVGPNSCVFLRLIGTMD